MSQPYDIAAHRFKAVPDWLQGELRAYLLEYKRPGAFLYALLCEDLIEAHSINPNVSQMAMSEIIDLLFAHFKHAWGNVATVEMWLDDSDPFPGLPCNREGLRQLVRQPLRDDSEEYL